MFDTKIKIFNIEIEEGEDELILDLFPKDSGHLISVELSNWIDNLDLFGRKAVGEKGFIEIDEVPG